MYIFCLFELRNSLQDVVYKMVVYRINQWALKRFINDGELPPPTRDDGVSSSVEVMVATGDFLLRWCYL